MIEIRSHNRPESRLRLFGPVVGRVAVRCLFWGGGVLAAAAPSRWLLDSVAVPTALLSLSDASAVSTPATPPSQHLFAIDGDVRPAIFAHPPSRIEWTLALPRGRYGVETAVALDPEVWAESDGARFRLSVLADGRTREVGEISLAPRANPEHRQWVALSGAFTTPGEALVLSLGTDVGEAGDGRYDRAYWEAPRIVGGPLPPAWIWIAAGAFAMTGAALLARRLGTTIRPPKQLCYVVFTVCAGLLLTEVVLRLVSWPDRPAGPVAAVVGLESAAWMAATIPDPELGYRYRPNLSVTWPWTELPAWRPDGTVPGVSAPTREQWLRTDADGFCNPPGIVDPELVVLGDSFAAGDLVDSDSRLSTALAGETGMRVRDLAVSGYGPQQYASALERFGLSSRPRTVVLALFEGNDIHDAEYYDQWRRTELTWKEYTLALFRARRESILIRPRGPSRVLSAFAEVGVRVLGAATGQAAVVPPPDGLNPVCGRPDRPHDCVSFSGLLLYRETLAPRQWRKLEGWRLTRRVLRGIQELCQGAGARLMVVLIPTKESLLLRRFAGSFSEAGFEDLVARIARDSSGDADVDGDGVGVGVGVARPTYLERFLENHGSAGGVLRDFLDTQRIEVLDLRPIFEREIDAGRLPYFRFDIHWNRAGHAVAARSIAATLAAGGGGAPQRLSSRSDFRPGHHEGRR